MQKKVSIIVPAYNEEASLPALYSSLCTTLSELDQYDFELLFVNDGSHDGSQAILERLAAEDHRVAYVELSRNFGKEAAMLAGFDYASGDCAVIIDADLQHPPKVIAEMLAWWEQGYEDVYARRRTRGKESWLRRRLTMAFYHILARSSRYEVLQNVGDFRLLDRKCIDALRQLRETERYTKGLYSWIGFRKREICFDQEERRYGQSHWSLWQLGGLALEGIVSFSTAPLRLATIVGFITGIGAFVYMVYTFIKAVLYGDPVAGYPTLICVMLFLGSVQLICLGILGEYLGRIFNESKRRPNYVQRSTFNVQRPAFLSPLSLFYFFVLLFFNFANVSPLCAQSTWNARYQQYIDQYKDCAIEQMIKWKVPASITLAQGLLESGAGQSRLAAKGNNHFGIKCHGWQKATIMSDDETKNECFRTYDSPYESFEDHSRFLATGQRYKSLFALKITDYRGWAKGLKAAGYATNPQYANRLIELIQLYKLYNYDKAKKYDHFLYDHTKSSQPLHLIKTYNKNYYLIARRGDTFRSIGSELDISYKKIASYNERNRDDILKEGEIVWLKKKQKKAAREYKGRKHYVRAGESMYSIAQKYGIRLKSLYKMNHLDPDYTIQVGDQLKLR